MFERLKQNHFWRFQGPMIVWAIALFVQSSIPSNDLPDWGILSHDKIIHFLIYVVFAATVSRAVRFQKRYPLLAGSHFFSTFIIVAVYAASDEFHQYFVPGRNCSLLDWLADCSGAIVYLTSFWIKEKLQPAAVSE